MSAKINEMHKSTAHRKSGAQSGQAIVLIALAMVALLGMAGLALDGGSMLFLQRKAQTVADLAAMSAAVAKCDDSSSTDPEAAALQVAAANEVSADDVTVSFPNGTDVSVVVQLPKDPYFIQVVYHGEMIAEGRSVTRCRVDSSSGENPYGDAVLFATSQDCPYTLYTSGNNVLYEGSLRSNAEMWLSITDDSSNVYGTVTGTANYVTLAAGNRREIWAATPPHDAGWGGLDLGGHGIPVINDPNDDSDADLFQGPVQPAPLLYDIDDFGPGGSIWEATPANRRHPLPGGNYSWPGFMGANELPTSGGKVQGLYFVNGDFIVTNDSRPMDGTLGDGVTIVATGRIRFNSGPLILEPYYSNLTMMSGYGTGTSNGYQNYEVGDSITTGGTCGGQYPSSDNSAIYLPTQQGGVVFGTEARPGLLYAPWGTVKFGTGNVGPTYGQIIAYGINSEHNSSAIHYRPGVGGGSTGPSPQVVSFVH